MDSAIAIAIVIIVVIVSIVNIVNNIVIFKIVMTRWHNIVTGFVSIIVERVEGIFLVLRPEDAVKEEGAVRFFKNNSATITLTIVMMARMTKLAIMLVIL